MTRPRQKFREGGFTVMEMGIIVVILVAFVGILLPALQRPQHGTIRVRCTSNLKQIVAGYRMFANDNNGSLPQFVETNEAWQYFQVAGDQLSSPLILLCPMDSERFKAPSRPREFSSVTNADSFSHPSHRNNSLSYFYGANATNQDDGAHTLLSGDRHLWINNKRPVGVALLGTNLALHWGDGAHKDEGNLLFLDGNVVTTPSIKLRETVAAVTNQPQYLIFP